MKKLQSKYRKSISGAVLWMMLIAGWSAAFQPQKAEADEATAAYALELINQIRTDPLGYAETLGYSRENLLLTLPWLEAELSQGLPYMSFSEFLTQDAALENNGGEDESRTGYNNSFARTGKISGAISFNNFMAPETAVQIIINDRLVQELSAGYTGQRCILGKEFTLAGAAFGGLTIDGVNTYLLTISMGSSTLKTERQVLNKINQLRSDPVGAGALLNMDLSVFSGVYPPLFFDDVLQSFISTPYASDPNFRIHLQNYGYVGYGIGELAALGDFPKTDLNMVADWMFSALVVNEVKGLGNGLTILGSYLNDIALDLVYMAGETWDHASMSVIAGLSADPAPGKDRIYGLVFNDMDWNGYYSPGEGRSGRTVFVYTADTFDLSAVVFTDNTGHFEVELEPGKAYVVFTGEGDTFSAGTLTMYGDQFLRLVVVD